MDGDHKGADQIKITGGSHEHWSKSLLVKGQDLADFSNEMQALSTVSQITVHFGLNSLILLS